MITKTCCSKRAFLCLLETALMFATSVTFADSYDDFYYSVNEDESSVTITSYEGVGGAVVIPDRINGLPVVTIGTAAFANHLGITAISFSASVTNIGEWAFSSCYNLNGLTIPGSVKTIGDHAFYGCDSVAKLVLEPGVQAIGTSAFDDCDTLASVSLPNSLISIGESAFCVCDNLSSIALPEGVAEIGAYAFAACYKMKTIAVPSTVTNIGTEAFGSYHMTAVNVNAKSAYYSSVDGVLFNKDRTTLIHYPDEKSGSTYVIPSGVTRIAALAFSDCFDLTSITIPASVTNIGSEAFYNCEYLTSLTIPSKVMRIGNNAFENCKALKSVYFNWNAPSRGADLFVCWSGRSAAIVYYILGTTGWGATYSGQPTALWDGPPKASQKITFKALPEMAIGDADFVPEASSSSGLPLMYSSSNEAIARIVDGLIHIVGAGAAVITASQAGSVEYAAAASVSQKLAVKGRLSADVPGGGGTVSGAGLYASGAKVTLKAKPSAAYTFLRWEDGSQVAARSIQMPATSITVAAYFGLTAAVALPVIAEPGAQTGMVGVAFTQTLDIRSASLATVSVKGLPAGLKYVSATKKIAGVPTKAGTFTVTVTAKNVNKTAAAITFVLQVEALPAWAQGTFNGVTATDALGHGLATMSVTAQGKVTGKVALAGTNYSFSAASYARRDELGAFWLTTTAKVAKVAFPLTVAINVFDVTNAAGAVVTRSGQATGDFGEEGDGWLSLYRAVWKDVGMAAEAASYAGSYTVTLAGGDGSAGGALAFTVDKVGGVKTAGRLASGTAVSTSGALVLDETERVWTVVYASSKGVFFAVAEFVKADDGSVSVQLLNGQ